MGKNKHIGGDFIADLREDGILEEIDARVQKRVIAEKLRAAMVAAHISEARLAKSMATSRTVVRNLLNPDAASTANLATIAKAAAAVGCRFVVTIERIEFASKPRAKAPVKRPKASPSVAAAIVRPRRADPHVADR